MNLDQAAERAVRSLPNGVREGFLTDPLRALRQELSLTVQPAEHLEKRAEGGACDGMSFLRDGVVLYARSPHSRRENFTLAHELGHWLVLEVESVLDWVSDQEDSPRVLESLCDIIAQKLLLPDAHVEATLPPGTPVRAEQVMQLFTSSQASRPACAIALARRIPGLGAVTIFDRLTRTVSHSSIHPDPDEGWPEVYPWPGQHVPDGHPLVAMAVNARMTRRSFWQDQWGRRADYYLDALTEGTRLITVFAAQDLWDAEQLHLDGPRDFDHRPVTEIRCCGRTRVIRGWRCDACGEPSCLDCHRCRCGRQHDREQVCAGGCFMRYQRHLLVHGLCETCR